MLLRPFILLSCCTVVSAGFGQALRVSGRVLDDTTETGIPNATVEVTDGVTTQTTVTGNDGSFQFRGIPKGSAKLICRATDYIDFPTEVPLTLSTASIHQDIRLLKKNPDAGYIRAAASRANEDRGFSER